LKKLTRIAGTVISAALLFTGCGAPPTVTETVTETPIETVAPAEPAETVAPAETEAPAEAAHNVLPCIVADQGGFDDRSFNQSAYEGMREAADQLGIAEFPQIQSASDTDFGPNLQALVAQNCTLITATGFLFADAVLESAHANPDVHYLMVDNAFDEGVAPENVKTVLFDTAQAAFLAGYVAAAYSSREGGASHVGTFGGMALPTVTIFMDGFAQGVEYYNEQNGTNVQVTGWDRATQTGSFTGGFVANPEASATAQSIIAQGVDVILPVGGPIYQSALAAIKDCQTNSTLACYGRDIALIGVDQDIFYSDPTTQDFALTSILKKIDIAVRDSVLASAQGGWDPTPYVGTLANDGVGLAPFHNFEEQIPQDVRDKVEQLRQDIIAGNVHVDASL